MGDILVSLVIVVEATLDLVRNAQTCVIGVRPRVNVFWLDTRDIASVTWNLLCSDFVLWSAHPADRVLTIISVGLALFSQITSIITELFISEHTYFFFGHKIAASV